MFCECGCGKLTRVSERNHAQHGYVKGTPRRFIMGHHGKRPITVRGYRTYQRRALGVYTTLHRVIAERALGKPLPVGSEVHHVDSANLDRSALVICQDIKYHRFLHVRMRVVRAGGNPNTQRICGVCKRLRLIKEMVSRGALYPKTCKECHARREREKRASRRLGVVQPESEPVFA